MVDTVVDWVLPVMGGPGVEGCCCASSLLRAREASRSVSGLFTIFSSLNRLRADTGGQLRISTVSSCRNSVLGIENVTVLC